MRIIITLVFLMTIFSKSFSQEDSLRFKLDSIVNEANVLYSHEKAVWVSTDLLLKNKKLKRKYGTYIVYNSKDTLIVSYISKNLTERIAKYSFLESNLKAPIYSDFEVSKLTSIEQELLDIKFKINDQLSASKYKFVIPQGYNPNLILIKEDEGYKLYIIMGTKKRGSIPFGNDYLFIADLKGDIFDWKKFHSRMIPAPFKGPSGGIVISAVHSHLKTTPYITATDICTFRLYKDLCDIEEFKVLCTATGKTYKYNINSNRIEIVEE